MATIVMDPAFEVLLKKYGVAADMQAFLLKNKIVNVTAYGLLATDEACVKPDIVEVAKAAGVKFDTLDIAVNLKLLWKTCRKSMTKEDDTENNASPDAPLNPETAASVLVQWEKHHNFTLPDAWMLIPQLVGKIWRDLQLTPPKVDVLLAESLRQVSCATKPNVTSITTIPGEVVRAQAVIADSVTRPVELYQRIRAWFFSEAYASIVRPDFFDLQTAISASDQILTFVTQTFDGHHAPMRFYLNAWAATIHFFSESVRLQKLPLKSVVSSTGQWVFRWTNWTPPANNGNSENHTRGDGNVDLPKSVRDEMNRLRNIIKDLHGKCQAAEARANSKGPKGKGGGKGKDQGKDFGKNFCKNFNKNDNQKRDRDERDFRDRRAGGSDRR